MFVRLVRPVGHSPDVDTLARGIDQLSRHSAATRLEVTAGKFAASDLFDLNRYANTTRTQFMNWALFQNTAWDFAADTRGYTNGVAVAWISRRWSLRIGSFQMPREANGNKFDSDLRRARGDNVELTVSPAGEYAPIVRLLGFSNHARMGSYADALARAERDRTPPTIVGDDEPGRSKRGWGLNIEQPIANGGETGVFVRTGGNDGANESFAFTEVDRHVSAGVQLSGANWRREDDRFAIAIVRHDIAAVHQRYLAAGGIGFLLGDGALSYGSEQVVEAYYRAQVGARVQVSPDMQVIRNPGYNRDRGPATVLSLRVNFKY
jgi:carbohydrate-selective porin OprB